MNLFLLYKKKVKIISYVIGTSHEKQGDIGYPYRLKKNKKHIVHPKYFLSLSETQPSSYDLEAQPFQLFNPSLYSHCFLNLKFEEEFLCNWFLYEYNLFLHLHCSFIL